MICKECAENGLKSQVRFGPTFDPKAPADIFYDEKGVLHYHDPNQRVTPYHCTEGHNFKVTQIVGCPGCGKNNEEKYERVL